MYDPIFAKSFSRYEQKRFGFWAILVCMIMVVSICMEFKDDFHPLSLIGNAMNLQLSINGAQDMLITKDKGISPPLATEAKEVESTDKLMIKEIDDPPSSLVEAKDVQPINILIMKDMASPHPLETPSKEVEEPPEIVIMKNTSNNPPLAMHANEEKSQSNQVNKMEPICNFMEPLSDYCDIKGDIRIEANSSTIFIVSHDHMSNFAGNNSWSIQPYARKGNVDAMMSVKKWAIKLVGDDGDNYIPKCSLNHSVPSILFSAGGFSGNTFHDFADLLVPIYSNSQQFNGEVDFLATDYAHWWISKYKMFFSRLSRQQIVSIDQEKNIHCYSRMVVGLKSHREFRIDPSKFPNGLSMNHFRQFLRSTYSLERTKAIQLKKGNGKKPRLMLISRRKTRLITNEDEVTRMARKLGYDVIVAEAEISTNLTAFAQLVNSCDVLMGVHGAGLTNMVFLPDNAILIQIIPLGGIDWYARVDFGKPSEDMNIQYLEYKIKVTESSLIQQYPLDHAVFRDPSSIQKQGWGAIRSTYLDKQNVRIDLRRFRPTLVKTTKLLRRH